MESIRSWLALTKAVPANGFTPDNSNLSPFMQRLARAHANCIEGLPIFGGLMLVAIVADNTALTDPLALSLHTTKADLREHLQPKAQKIAPADLMELGEAYARSVGYPIQYQWTLLKGTNDGQDELDEILRLLKGKYAVLNLIPFNSLEGDDYQRPDGPRIIEIVRYLHSRGVLTKVRNSAGQDVDGGCGQLRARAIDIVNTSRLRIR